MCTKHGDEPLALLQQALADLSETDSRTMTDQRVRDELKVLVRAFNQMAAVVARRLEWFDTRALSSTDDLRTTRTWLQVHGRMSQGSATGWLKRARLLRQMPALSAAAARGDATADHLAPVVSL